MLHRSELSEDAIIQLQSSPTRTDWGIFGGDLNDMVSVRLHKHLHEKHLSGADDKKHPDSKP